MYEAHSQRPQRWQADAAMFTVMTSKSLTTLAVWILDFGFSLLEAQEGWGEEEAEVWMIGLIGFASSISGEKDSTGFLATYS